MQIKKNVKLKAIEKIEKFEIDSDEKIKVEFEGRVTIAIINDEVDFTIQGITSKIDELELNEKANISGEGIISKTVVNIIEETTNAESGDVTTATAIEVALDQVTLDTMEDFSEDERLLSILLNGLIDREEIINFGGLYKYEYLKYIFSKMSSYSNAIYMINEKVDPYIKYYNLKCNGEEEKCYMEGFSDIEYIKTKEEVDDLHQSYILSLTLFQPTTRI